MLGTVHMYNFRMSLDKVILSHYEEFNLRFVGTSVGVVSDCGKSISKLVPRILTPSASLPSKLNDFLSPTGEVDGGL